MLPDIGGLRGVPRSGPGNSESSEQMWGRSHQIELGGESFLLVSMNSNKGPSKRTNPVEASQERLYQDKIGSGWDHPLQTCSRGVQRTFG